MKIESAPKQGFVPVVITIESASELVLLLRLYGKMHGLFDVHYPRSTDVYEYLLNEVRNRGINHEDSAKFPLITLELEE